jgi:hypothetical protein
MDLRSDFGSGLSDTAAGAVPIEDVVVAGHEMDCDFGGSCKVVLTMAL